MTFKILRKHFFDRLFDNEMVAEGGDARESMVRALALLAVPGMMTAMYMLPRSVRRASPEDLLWMLAADRYFFVSYSMIVMGFVMVFQWDKLFPDRRDVLILAPLPIGKWEFLTAKIASLLLFGGLFLLDVNFFGMVMVPLLSNVKSSVGAILQAFFAHAVAVLAAGSFAALVVAGMQGVLINLLPPRLFRRVSMAAQMVSVAVLVVLLFTIPLAGSAIRPLIQQGSTLPQSIPFYWFLGIYVELSASRGLNPAFGALAQRGWNALGIALAVFLVTFGIGYWRHVRRLLESAEAAASGPGWLRRAFEAVVNRWVLAHPHERACFHFITQTILRSPRHRLFLATYGGIGIAVALPSLLYIDARGGGSAVRLWKEGFVAVPLTLSFFLVSGLRAAFNFPAELRANWLFQISGGNQPEPFQAGMRRWLLWCGIVPLFVVLAPAEFYLWGAGTGLLQLAYGVVLTLILVELLFSSFRKIPFTCAYLPSRTNLALLGFLYFYGFGAYALTMANLLEWLSRQPVRFMAFFAAAALVLYGLRWWGRHPPPEPAAIIFADEGDPAVRRLELT